MDLWEGLPVWAQEIAVLSLLLAPLLLTWFLLFRGFAPWRLTRALLSRFRVANLIFIALISVSVGIGIGLISQERGLRRGSARAADKFDLVVSAPGSEITMLMAAVYLRPADVPLLSGPSYDRIARDERVRIAAPIAFGDSFKGAPIVGTIADFVTHLAGTDLEGDMFANHEEAVAGAATGLAIGDIVVPAHGVGASADEHAHGEGGYLVTGILPVTGSPWDRAILVPLESVWEVHGLGHGHALADGEVLGPPFDPARFPGTPAVVVVPQQLGQAYSLQSEFTRDAEMMAFLPGAVLSQLHSVLGDVRKAMSVLSLVSQVIVATSVLLGVSIMLQLFRREIALLGALGAPVRFVVAVIWSYAAGLMVAGGLLGVAVGWGMVSVLSVVLSRQTGIAIDAALDWSVLRLVVGSITVTSLLALILAWTSTRNSSMRGLRA